MAEPVRRVPGLNACAALALAVLPALGLAQQFQDPTRPPPAFIQSGAADEAPPEEGESLELQSILVSAHRRQAVIGGKVVKVGDSIGQAKVVRISEDTVVLRTGRQNETLKLFPNIDKRKVSRQKDRTSAAATE